MNIFSIPEFRTGLVAGSVVMVGLACAALGAPERYRRPLPVGGLAFAAAALVAIGIDRSISVVLVVATAGLAAVIGLTSRSTLPVWAPYALAAPFGYVIGFHTGIPGNWWVQVLVALVASAGAVLVAETDLEWREEAPTLALYLITMVGMYLAVPDTEEAAALVGVILPLAILGWPLCAVALGRPGAAATTAVFVWAAAVGGQARPASIVGSVACLALLVGLPLGRALLPPGGVTIARAPRIAVLGLIGLAQVVLVLIASRVAGARGQLSSAVPTAILVGVLSVLAGAALQAVEAVEPTPPPE